jgi:hypothetical protein
VIEQRGESTGKALHTIFYILSTINNGVLGVESLVIWGGRGRVPFTVHDLIAHRP